MGIDCRLYVFREGHAPKCISLDRHKNVGGCVYNKPPIPILDMIKALQEVVSAEEDPEMMERRLYWTKLGIEFLENKISRFGDSLKAMVYNDNYYGYESDNDPLEHPALDRLERMRMSRRQRERDAQSKSDLAEKHRRQWTS
jgi:hypothetical protein